MVREDLCLLQESNFVPLSFRSLHNLRIAL